jgi:hypothetical protein
MRRAILALSTLLLVVGCAGSAGNAARERALLPALRSAWPGVEADVQRGVNDGLDDGDLTGSASDALMASADRLEKSLSATIEEAKSVTGKEWPALHPWAARGVMDRVDDGEIGAGVAASLNERIVQFDAAIDALQGR